MNKEILDKFDDINMNKKDDYVAPHKPLLILYAIGKLRRDGIRMHSYTQIDKDLGILLKEFGSYETKGTQEPFWRLQKDCVWYVTKAERISENDKGGVNKGDLKEHKTSGGFHEGIAKQLIDDNELVNRIIDMMLAKPNPPLDRDKVLAAVGIEYPY